MIFELFICIWLVLLTMWMLVFKRGPRGPKGDQSISSYCYHDPMDALDNQEYITALIQKINALQLHGGKKLDETS